MRCLLELLSCVDGGDDDGDIFFRGICWILWQGYWPIGEARYDSNEVP